MQSRSFVVGFRLEHVESLNRSLPNMAINIKFRLRFGRIKHWTFVSLDSGSGCRVCGLARAYVTVRNIWVLVARSSKPRI